MARPYRAETRTLCGHIYYMQQDIQFLVPTFIKIVKTLVMIKISLYGMYSCNLLQYFTSRGKGVNASESKEQKFPKLGNLVMNEATSTRIDNYEDICSGELVIHGDIY